MRLLLASLSLSTLSLVPILLLHPIPPVLAGSSDPAALLQQGRVDEASFALTALIAAHPADARPRQLLCRALYVQDMVEAAIPQCERAVANDPADSENRMWLARAYGIKASTANPLAALTLAKKVHTGFERAVALDPNNVRAMSDLGEYYVAAPAIVGGGLDKAQVLAATMQPRFPSQAHRLLAFIAEKKKDDADAETEFRNAVDAGHTPAAYIDLGHFYQRHNQPARMLEALRAGVASDHHKDASLVDAASILTEAHSSPQLAEDLLRTYLASPAKSDDAPAFKVHLQLGNLLAQNGDPDSAHREYASALALASNFAPARKALQGPSPKAIP